MDQTGANFWRRHLSSERLTLSLRRRRSHHAGRGSDTSREAKNAAGGTEAISGAPRPPIRGKGASPFDFLDILTGGQTSLAQSYLEGKGEVDYRNSISSPRTPERCSALLSDVAFYLLLRIQVRRPHDAI